MSRYPQRNERAPRATGKEARELSANWRLACALYDLSLESSVVAMYSACADRSHAAKCYAAIVRSLG